MVGARDAAEVLMTVRRSRPERTGACVGDAAFRVPPLTAERRGMLGVQGGRSVPLASRSVQHCVGWLPPHNGREPAPGSESLG